MSTETHVFFRGRLPSKAALSREMKALGFPFSIKPARGSLERQDGFMPMLLKREETGVEFDVFDDAEDLAEMAVEGVDPSFNRVANFRWSSDSEEMLAGVCAAAALAKLVNGVAFDEAEDRLLSIEEAIEIARKNLEALARPSEQKQRGTRPADIKHYLKPLLEMRSDLVLIGRMLIVRPVRHFLRGVFFDRTGSKYRVRIQRYIRPLHGWSGALGDDSDHTHDHFWDVYEPYFQPLLLDCLAQDFFDDLGRVASFDDFARWLEENRESRETQVSTLLLAGHRARAFARLDEIERDEAERNWTHWAKDYRPFFERDIGELCAIHHAREAKTAKELKLGDVWEPTPFPVEVPESERSNCADPLFVPHPWIASPPWLWQELPQRPGDVRFAKHALRRGGEVALAVALTRDEAEELHRGYQKYVLATQLSSGERLMLGHDTYWSPYDPERPKNPDYVPMRHFYLSLLGPSRRVSVVFTTDFNERETMHGTIIMFDVNVRDVDGKQILLANNVVREGVRIIHDWRSGEKIYTRQPITESDLAMCRFQAPEFGDYGAFLDRVRGYLNAHGLTDLA